MIDKVDKPEAPKYRVRGAAKTQDRGSQKDQQERREEDEYSASTADKRWQKYHTDAMNRRSLKLRRKDIANLFFNQVMLQKGLVIIETDIQLINGRILQNAHLFSTKVDTYWKLKKFSKGGKIPVDQLISEEYIEVSILEKAGKTKNATGVPQVTKETTVATNQPQSSWSLWPLVDEKSGKVNWVAIILYTIIVVGIFVSLMTIL